MTLTPPFTNEEFLESSRVAWERPENEEQIHEKPRASGLAGCAREQAYMMRATPKTNPNKVQWSERVDSNLTAEQGRRFEDISAEVIEAIPDKGLLVKRRQVCIGHEAHVDPETGEMHEQGPIDFWCSGHPDGEIHQWIEKYFDPQGSGLVSETINGAKWGWEHKHLGRWGYQGLFKAGSVEVGHPSFLVQGLCYALALGWDAILVHVIGQDASSNRSDATSNRQAKKPKSRWANAPDWNPKAQFYTIDVEEMKHLAGMLENRARWLTDNVDPPEAVMREADPESVAKRPLSSIVDGELLLTDQPNFPCSYCPWLDKCLEDGEGTKRAPQLPFTAQD